jgi:hypothetical protein
MVHPDILNERQQHPQRIHQNRQKAQQGTTNSAPGNDRSTMNHGHGHPGSPRQPAPTRLMNTNLCHQVAIRLASHPTSHPISPLIHCASRRYVAKHKTLLHHLTQAYSLNPDSIEKIHPSRHCPNESSPHNLKIPKSREASICHHNKWTHGTRVYTDGSGLNGNIGAAAILSRPNGSTTMLHYHLGTNQQHTVYDSEVVRFLLAAHLLSEEADVVTPVTIFVDNQAIIKSGDVFKTKPSHYLTDLFHTNVQ